MWIQPLFRLAAAIACGLTLSAPDGSNHPQGKADSSAVKEFLKQHLHLTDPVPETSVAIRSIDLNSDNRDEQVVYVRGDAWCGSGGCLALVLRRTKTSYQVIGRITIARLPIRALDVKSNGWRSIGVWVQGGGIKQGYEAVLSFDGKKYPGNPTVPPAVGSVTEPSPGKVLLSDGSSFDRLH